MGEGAALLQQTIVKETLMCLFVKAELAVHKKKIEEVENWIRVHTNSSKVIWSLIFHCNCLWLDWPWATDLSPNLCLWAIFAPVLTYSFRDVNNNQFISFLVNNMRKFL